MHVSNDRARAGGLLLTDPQITLKDFQAWIKDRQPMPMLSAEREAELIGIAKKQISVTGLP